MHQLRGYPPTAKVWTRKRTAKNPGYFTLTGVHSENAPETHWKELFPSPLESKTNAHK